MQASVREVGTSKKGIRAEAPWKKKEFSSGAWVSKQKTGGPGNWKAKCGRSRWIGKLGAEGQSLTSVDDRGAERTGSKRKTDGLPLKCEISREKEDRA